MTEFEQHSRRFIELSPFLVISTTGSDGIGDVSPRGDAPGFVKVMDDNRTIAIPDRRRNNRIDTLTNIVTNLGRYDLLHSRCGGGDAGQRKRVDTRRPRFMRRI